MAALQKLTDEFLTCIICQDVFKDPTTLHCGHTFCGACITSYVLNRPEAQAEKSIPCPHCRQLTKVPDPENPVEEWAGQLKTGFFVKGLVETFVAEDNVLDPVLCSPCKEAGETTPADKWCADCSEALCSSCLNLHTQYPKFREHKTANLDDGLKNKDSADKHLCPEHKDEKLKLFCKDCDKAICQLCCSVYHRKCDSVLTLTEAYPQMKQDLVNKVFDMQLSIVKSESVFSERKSQLNRLMESCDEAMADVDAACEEYIQSIETKQAEIKENIATQTDEAARILTSDLETAESACKQTARSVAVIQSAVQSGTEIELYDTYKIFCSKNNPKPPHPEAKDEEATPRMTEINFESHVDQLTKALHTMNIGALDVDYDKTEESIGEAEDNPDAKGQMSSKSQRKKQTRKPRRRDKKPGNDLPRTSSIPGPDGRSNLSSKFTSEESLSGKGAGRKAGPRGKGAKAARAGSDTDSSPVLLEQIDVRADIDQKDPNIEDVITVPDGESDILVLTDFPNRKVKALYRRNGQKLFVEFQHPPSGLTQVSDNEVAVAVRFAFKIYLIRLRPHLQIFSHIETKKGYTHICHLDEKRFAASSVGDKVIDIIDATGNVTKRLENDNISRAILYKTNLPGQILVCDPETHSVSRLSTNNKVSFRYEPYGVHRLVDNLGAAVDNKGNIYVVNKGGNKVIMLNSVGKFVKPVLTMKAAPEKLSLITFDKGNRMYLTFEERYICVYQL